jgi:O-antigen/teichoic acid export membrane protein
MVTAGLARAGAATFAGTVVGAALTFVLTGVVGNTLGAVGTGSFFQVVAIFAIVSSALQLGADTTLVRTLSSQTALGQHRWITRSVWTALLPVATVGVLAGLLVWLAAEPLATAIAGADDTHLASAIRAVAPFLGAGALLTVLLGGTRGLGGTLPYTLLQNIALPVLRLALVAAAAVAGLGVHGMITAWAVPLALVGAAAAVVLARSVLRARSVLPAALEEVAVEQVAPGDVVRFWRFSLPRGGAALLERLLDWSGVLLVVVLAGPALGGVYAVVNRCASAGYMLDTAARIVTGPRISRALAVGDIAAAEALFLTVTRAMVLLSWPFYLLLAVFAPAVLALFGPEFPAGAPALALVSLALMLATAAGMVQSVLLMGGRSSWQLGNRIVQLGTMVGLTVVLVPWLGLVGAALAWVAAIAVDTALAGTQVARRMRIRTSLRRIAPAALLAVTVFGGGGLLIRVLLGPSLPALLLAVLVLGAAYAAGAFLLRTRLGLTRVAISSPTPDVPTRSDDLSSRNGIPA